MHIEVLSLWVCDAMHPAGGLPDYGAAGATSMLMFLLSAIAIALYMHISATHSVMRWCAARRARRNFYPSALAHAGLRADRAMALSPFSCRSRPIRVSLLPFLQPPSAAALAELTLKNCLLVPSMSRAPLANTLLLIAR
jgi:hypothetical protein